MTRSASARLHASFGARCAVAVVLGCATGGAGASDFRSTAEAATVLYDAPSAKARPLFVLGRDTPLEVIVPVEGWIKVRDAGGTIGWVDKGSLADRRSLVVRVPLAEVRAHADDAAPLVFRAEQNVLLELAERAIGASATATPGWVRVRHRDGQAGFVRIAQVFGL
jgi:SH3-like domain-containing protein